MNFADEAEACDKLASIENILENGGKFRVRLTEKARNKLIEAATQCIAYIESVGDEKGP